MRGLDTDGAGGITGGYFCNSPDHDPVAEFHPFFPRVVPDAPPPNPTPNPAQVHLAEAIVALDRARGAVELAAAPVHRLTDVIVEGDQLTTQLRELVDRDQRATGEWLASGRVGPEPGDAADTRALRARLDAMQPELAAAQRSLPEKEALHRAAIERLGEAAAARAAALDEVAVVVADGVAGELTAAINEALTIEAKSIWSRHSRNCPPARGRCEPRPSRSSPRCGSGSANYWPSRPKFCARLPQPLPPRRRGSAYRV